MSRTKKREPSSAQLIQKALLELLQKKSYDTIPIYEICAQAAVSRNTFYRLYHTKDDALEALIKSRLQLSTTEYEKSRITSFQQIDHAEVKNVYITHYRFWKTQETFLTILSKRGLFHHFVRLSPHLLETPSSDELLKTYCFDDNTISVSYFKTWLAVGLSMLLEQWTLHKFQQTPEEMADLTLKNFFIMGQIGNSIL